MKVTSELNKKRREYVIGLKMAGLATSTIVRQANLKDKLLHWGESTERSVIKDIHDYYQENRVLEAKDYKYLDSLRQVHIDSMERTIEAHQMFISNFEKDTKDSNGKIIKKGRKFKPFEFISAIKELHRMKMDYAEVMNWNMGRRNPFAEVSATKLLQDNYLDAGVHLSIAPTDVIKSLVAALDVAMNSVEAPAQFNNEDAVTVRQIENIENELGGEETSNEISGSEQNEQETHNSEPEEVTLEKDAPLIK